MNFARQETEVDNKEVSEDLSELAFHMEFENFHVYTSRNNVEREEHNIGNEKNLQSGEVSVQSRSHQPDISIEISSTLTTSELCSKRPAPILTDVDKVCFVPLLTRRCSACGVDSTLISALYPSGVRSCLPGYGIATHMCRRRQFRVDSGGNGMQCRSWYSLRLGWVETSPGDLRCPVREGCTAPRHTLPRQRLLIVGDQRDQLRPNTGEFGSERRHIFAIAVACSTSLRDIGRQYGGAGRRPVLVLAAQRAGARTNPH